MDTKVTDPSVKNTKIITNVVAPLLVILLFIGISIFSVQNKSDTTDEKFHLTRGIMLLETGDLRLNQHHPYLFNLIAALTTKLDTDLVTPSLLSENWIYSKKDEISFELVELNGGRLEFSEDVLEGPRIMMISVTGLLLFVMFFYLKKLFGYQVAMIVLILLALDPNFIAHARLVTTDASSTITMFIAVLAFYDYLRSKEKYDKQLFKTYLILGFVLTIALLSKYTAVFAVSILLILLFTLNFIKNKHGAFFARIFRSARQPLLLTLFIMLMLTAAYKFEFSLLSDMTYGNEAKLLANLDGFTKIARTSEALGSLLEKIYTTVPLPFPQYINGFYENVFKHNLFGHRSFLLGEFSNGGWWYYFPITYLVKEPLLTIFGFVIALILTTIRSIKKRSIKWLNSYNLALIIPPILIFGLSMQSSINLGVRHLLPIFPFVFLLMAQLFIELNRKLKFKHFLLFGVVLILALIPTFRVFPHYISYFNISAGSPGNGYKIVRDSNFDWNQNDLYVSDYVNVHNDSDITTDTNEYADHDHLIISKEDLYGNPDTMSEQIKTLNKMLDNEEASIRDEIALTHVLIKFR